MPLLVNVVPGLRIPVPGLAWLDVPPDEVSIPLETEDASAVIATDSGSTIQADFPIAAAIVNPRLMPQPTLPSEPALPRRDENVFTSANAATTESFDHENEQAAAATQPESIEWRAVISAFLSGLISTYLTIVLLLSIRLLVGMFRAAKMIRASVPVMNAERFVPLAHAHMLRESRTICVPVTVGLRRPYVLLPVGWRKWSEEKQAAVLQHELTHIAHGDFFVNLLAQANRCLYWFHPLAWWLIRWLSDLAERNCDDAVIASTGDRMDSSPHSVSVRLRTRVPTQSWPAWRFRLMS